MTLQKINPAALGSEPAAYSNAMLAQAPQRTLYVAGQVGIDAKGVAAPDIAGQCRQAWANIQAILAEAGMGVQDIAKTTIFLTDTAHYATFAEIRNGVLKGHKPASTLVYVSALVKPDWKVEIEAIAVK